MLKRVKPETAWLYDGKKLINFQKPETGWILCTMEFHETGYLTYGYKITNRNKKQISEWFVGLFGFETCQLPVFIRVRNKSLRDK